MALNASIGRKLRGIGNTPSEIMVVCDQPTGYEYAHVKPFSDKKWNRLKKAVKEAGLKDVYYTYLVKYNTKTLKASDVKACIQDLIDEIVNVKPKLIICPGSFVLTGIATNKYPISRCRGSIITAGNQKILPIYDLTQIDKSPELWPAFIRDLKLAAKFQAGENIDPPKVVTTIVHTAEELKQTYYDFGSPKLIALDSEWDGRNWMDPNRYFRTIQLGLDQSCAIVIEVSTEGGVRCCEEGSMFKALKEILDKADIIGQNIIADGEWLLSYGIDIRKNVIFDTMLAEYILNSDLPVGLEELAMRYTDFGRYSTEVELWTHQNARKCKTGYGNVPRDLLMSYAGYDVCCLFPIMQAQLKELVQRGYLSLRGNYPSLFNTTMRTQEIIYELEINGMPVDIDRLKELIDIYQAKKAELLGLISTEAAVAGMESFNPNSTKDKQTLLYDKLGIAPVRTTDGKDWGEAVDKLGFDYDTEGLSAGTDKNTLAILATKHPVAKHLIWYNAVSQVCKTWLKYPDEDGEGGLIADLWEDGKLRSHFSQLTQTGRMRTSAPNCFPGEVEVLTDNGWMMWRDLYDNESRDEIRLAQWDIVSREITFAKPIGYVKHKDSTLHCYTEQYINLLCTDDHRVTIYNRKNLDDRKTICAIDLYKHSDWVLPQAGNLVKDGKSLTEDQVIVACAFQADGHAVKNGGIDWRFKKERKINRLVKALKSCGIKYRQYKTSNGKRIGVYVGKHDVPEWLLGMKFFGKWLLEYNSETLSLFEKEVWHWDGCESRSSMYASKQKENADYVQILCLFNGRRSKIRKYLSNKGSLSWQVDASNRWYSHLANLKAEQIIAPNIDDAEDVYCVSMPKDTVIVRYHGRVSFTNQCQNFPKKAEGVIAEVFKDKQPPLLRTIVKPPTDWTMVESDYCTAEIACLAHLSGDPNMLKVISTPGMDMHDKSAVDGFGFHMEDEDGNEITIEDLVRIAKEEEDNGGENSERFQHIQKNLTYIAKDGKRYTRSQFKSGPRIAAKSISFALPYGIAAASLSFQIKSQTGDPRDLGIITAEVSTLMDTWKTKTFPVAWSHLVDWQQRVYNPGWIENPWGRRKWLRTYPGEINRALEREAGNFPMQSTIADTIQIASDRLLRKRKELNLGFRLQNQIHDALMLEVPKSELEQTKQVLTWAMSEIDIPTFTPGKTFRLACDIDEYVRWGEKASH